MAAELWGDPDRFARYKRASEALAKLQSNLAELRAMPAGESRENAIAGNVEATRLAMSELETAILAYLPPASRLPLTRNRKTGQKRDAGTPVSAKYNGRSRGVRDEESVRPERDAQSAASALERFAPAAMEPLDRLQTGRTSPDG